MKKLFITIVMAFMAVAGFAQTTFNVRAGGGFFQNLDHNNSYYGVGGLNFGPTLALETNIPLGARTNRFVFSPSVAVISDFSDVDIIIPLHFGYKIRLGGGAFFIPKIGPMIAGRTDDSDFQAMIGPSTELAFEIKHFVVAANCYLDLIDEVKVGAFCTLGYKF